MAQTNGEWLREQADRLGIPPRTLEQVAYSLAQAKKKNADASLRRLLLSPAARLTAEARAYVEAYEVK